MVTASFVEKCKYSLWELVASLIIVRYNRAHIILLVVISQALKLHKVPTSIFISPMRHTYSKQGYISVFSRVVSSLIYGIMETT